MTPADARATVEAALGLVDAATQGEWYSTGTQWDTAFVHDGAIKTTKPINDAGFDYILKFGTAHEANLALITEAPATIRQLAGLVLEMAAENEAMRKGELCKRGHSMTGNNLYVYEYHGKVMRRCRTCVNWRAAQYYEQKRNPMACRNTSKYGSLKARAITWADGLGRPFSPAELRRALEITGTTSLIKRCGFEKVAPGLYRARKEGD